MKRPTLYIFSGLPAVGKTAIARKLSETLKSTYLRIDTIEQGIKDLCFISVQGEGYRLAYRIAKDNLKLGINVIADSCNPWNLTRDEWEQCANECNSDFINIEIVCSDKNEHMERVKNRVSDIPNLNLPSWDDITNRKYEDWTRSRIIIDTAGKMINQSFDELKAKLNLL